MVAKSTASDQPDKMANSAARNYFPGFWIPKRLHRTVIKLSLSLFPRQRVKQAADEEKVLSKTPWPTLSEAGCMERVSKVLSIRYNSKTASHLLYKCQRALWHLSGGGENKWARVCHRFGYPVKQRTLCTSAFCSKSPLEKFGIFFCSSTLYQKKENIYIPFPH